MLKVNEVEIPNTIFELTIEQFDKINTISADPNLEEIEKWVEKFVYLGADRDAFDDMQLTEFNELIQEWNSQPQNPTEKVKSIEIDGYTYEASDSIGVKDLGMIEKIWKAGTGMGTSETMAILFKRTDLSKTEHYASGHLKHKSKMFKSQNASLVVPYITEILEKLMEVTKKITDEAATEMESSKD